MNIFEKTTSLILVAGLLIFGACNSSTELVDEDTASGDVVVQLDSTLPDLIDTKGADTTIGKDLGSDLE